MSVSIMNTEGEPDWDISKDFPDTGIPRHWAGITVNSSLEDWVAHSERVGQVPRMSGVRKGKDVTQGTSESLNIMSAL